MSINTEINRLLNFAKQNMLINEDDYYYACLLYTSDAADDVSTV